MHEIRLTLSATDDLMNGFTFYESRETGVGDYFLQCLSSDIDSLGLYGGIHPKLYSGFYRTTSKRFPFSIYYQFDGTVVLVVAVIDTRRNPRTIARDLSDR